jgi:hypothetical protein
MLQFDCGQKAMRCPQGSAWRMMEAGMQAVAEDALAGQTDCHRHNIPSRERNTAG